MEDMARRGQEKLARRAATMQSSWEAARGRMTQGYQAAGFGPTRTSNYNAGIQNARYRAPDPSKGARNWLAKMRE
jgi:hypothetical protein